MAGAQFSGAMHLQINVAALNNGQRNVIALCGQAHATGGNNSADAGCQYNANHGPNEDATPFYARHLTPSPLGL
jgi:hypothetical protein